MRPDEMERISKTLHVGGISGIGEEIKENDIADFFGQHGASDTARYVIKY